MGKYKQLLLLPQKNGELYKGWKSAFCRNTTIHFHNFEIYKRSFYHDGRTLCKQVINHGSRTVCPYYIMTMPNKEDASSYLSSNDAWQLCMLSVVSCHQYLYLFKSSFFFYDQCTHGNSATFIKSFFFLWIISTRYLVSGCTKQYHKKT